MKKRLIVLLLMLLLAALVLPSSALALDAEEAEAGLVYTALGDSIPYGFSLTDPTPSDNCYPEQVGQLCGAQVVNLSNPMMTTGDLAASINDPAIVGALSASKLITVQTGTTDLVLGLLDYAMTAAGLDSSTLDLQSLMALANALQSGDEETIRTMIASLSGQQVTQEQIATFLESITDEKLEEVLDGIVHYYKYYMNSIIASIRQNAEDAVIVGVGLYNPYKNNNVNLTIQGHTFTYNIGALVDEAVKEMNGFLETLMPVYGGGYADVYSGIAIRSMLDPFPTDQGNLVIAQRILTSLGCCVISSAGAGGTVTPEGTLFTTTLAGTQYSVKADSGNLIKHLRVNGEEIAAAAGKSQYTFTFTDDYAANSIHSLTATFADPDNRFGTITTIGDSIAAGYSLPGYTGLNSNPPACYTAVVGDYYCSTNVTNLSVPAMTTSDFLSEYIQKPEYQQAVKDSDLVILEVGVNNLTMAMLGALVDVLGGDSSAMTLEDKLTLIEPFMVQNDIETVLANLGTYLGVTIDSETFGKILQKLETDNIQAMANEAAALFEAEWGPVVKSIHELNPSATIIAVGCYNTNINANFSILGKTYNVSDAFESFVQRVNSYTKGNEHTYGFDYTYVDIHDGIELLSSNYTSVDPHPTEAGHAEIARRIIRAIGDGAELPIGPVVPTPTEHVTKYYLVESIAGAGGKILAPTMAQGGKDVVFKIEPDKGYALDSLSVVAENGKKIKLSDGGNGYYYFTMPENNVSITAKFKGSKLNGFIDVDPTGWYADDIEYVLENGIMYGTSDNTFDPNGTMTRAMIVTMLYRLEGQPASNGVNPFDDVAGGMWYTKAIIWAASKDIVKGYGNGNFGPNDYITREQMAAIMYRYANYKGYKTSAAADLSGYADSGSISAWALPAMKWANAEGFITGRTTSTLVPDGLLTRAEAAAIFKRFMEKNK